MAGKLKKGTALACGDLEYALMGISKAGLADVVASLLRRCEGDVSDRAMLNALAAEWRPIAAIRGDRAQLRQQS